jgi:hypothetical protein
MKLTLKVLTIFLTIFAISISTYGKSLSGEIQLFNNATVLWKISNFNRAKHNITYCQYDTPKLKYPCLIDKKKWYGSDLPYDQPKIEFVYLKLRVNKQIIVLNTNSLYNPVYSLYKLNSHQFKLKKISNYYILYSFFADGAATYTVHWKIENGKSTRIKVSRDESDFEWQFE